MKIIFDYNRTLYDPETKSFYPGAVALVSALALKHELYLISRREPERANYLEQSGLKELFTDIAFVEEKTVALFQRFAGGDKNTVVIGDRVTEEITIGNRLGLRTVWLKQGKFAAELPGNATEMPTETINCLADISALISQYEK